MADTTQSQGFVARLIAFALRLRIVRALLHYQDNRGPMLADSVTYRALFSLFAAVFLGFSVAALWLVANPEAFDALITMLDRLIPGLIGAVDPAELLQPMEFTVAGIIALVGLVGAALGAASAHAQQVTIRWGDVVGGTHPSVQMIDRIAAEAKQKSGGRIVIQSFPGGQLGGSRDMIDAVANGAQQVVTEGAANFGAWVPSISVVEAPYIWRDAAHLDKAMNGPIGEQFNETLVKARGMRILGTTYYGTRHITTTSKEVRSPADMVGFKLRVPENDVFKAMAEAWGAKPTPMNFGELYLALKQNVVDGQENPLPTIKSGKFDEVQKYLVLTAHIITPRLVVVNEAFWQALSAGDRRIISDAVKNGIAWQNAELIRQEGTLVDTFKAAGMTVVTPDPRAFRDPVLAKVPKMFESKWGAGMVERIQAVR